MKNIIIFLCVFILNTAMANEHGAEYFISAIDMDKNSLCIGMLKKTSAMEQESSIRLFDFKKNIYGKKIDILPENLSFEVTSLFCTGDDIIASLQMTTGDVSGVEVFHYNLKMKKWTKLGEAKDCGAVRDVHLFKDKISYRCDILKESDVVVEKREVPLLKTIKIKEEKIQKNKFDVENIKVSLVEDRILFSDIFIKNKKSEKKISANDLWNRK